MDVTKIQGLDKKWQDELLSIMCNYETNQDKMMAIDRINNLTGLGVLYSSEVFKKLEAEFSMSAGVILNSKTPDELTTK